MVDKSDRHLLPDQVSRPEDIKQSGEGEMVTVEDKMTETVALDKL